ncbi:MAG TPA: glutamine--fructose-6-phosphate transaminase (isomerizing) [Dehalococcoidales bacterium]|nr:glutamine--fructose-6-phosphate transaminase (isomerizing) [Dehalococcoidales bacterium]
MCGIVGYIGNQQAEPILMDCLSRLEYRGYDSSGIAVRENDQNNDIKVYKDAVRVAVLQKQSPHLKGSTGIAHTRWATHGPPSLLNAHPHLDCSGRFAVVHNGIITNYQELKRQLINEGHHIVSETDTEVIPHLIEKFYKGNLENAVRLATTLLTGSFAIIVLCKDEQKLVVAKMGSPLVIGIKDCEKFIASDTPAILNYTDKVIYLEDGDVGVITDDNVIITRNGETICREEKTVNWCKADTQKGSYDHFMIKEIHEQPRVIRDTISENDLSESKVTIGNGVQSLKIIACGTSYYAGLIGEYIIEELLGIPTTVVFGSEFNHRRAIFPNEAIVITQSGETADVLSAMKTMRSAGVKMLAITNVPGSTASRISNRTIYTRAGPEVSVAATKSFIAELISLYQLVLLHPEIDHNIREQLVAELNDLPTKVEKLFDLEPQIIECAKYLAQCKDVFYIGRGVNFPIALEGALKLKEISYIHAEGYAAGELKHGPFALLNPGVPVIAIVGHDGNHESMLTSIKEIKARGAYVIALADEDDNTIDSSIDVVLKIPHTHALLSPVLNIIPLQLLAYYTAKLMSCPIDFPRNLAKSVTVD